MSVLFFVRRLQASKSRFQLVCNFFSAMAICVTLSVAFAGSANADIIHLQTIANSTNGEFGWDVFSGTYAGPHAPDQFSTGVGTAQLSVTPGGVITSTSNLYSLFSTPAWTFELENLQDSLPFTSVAIQLVANGTYNSNQFLLNGIVPDEFYSFGQVNVGGFMSELYWAAWQGIAAQADYTATLAAPTGSQHHVLAAAKVSYLNSANPQNIQAIPEPSSGVLVILAVCICGAIRRKSILAD